eukprot:CAMPEP_0176029728 /NCGR_PEP_ID=MMETSP0120_2-20121206/14613_1 /TAXON_ID=160619 /ORGANISM="Kryptoperidinium foliaceum, Strain CCMP 1326" /LENGTH=107 /DNA_ID=CAMNT_0017362959 /DNA_START=95 /DNA_END=418 /DNA_ORIENTATION=+
MAVLGNTPDAYGQTWHLPCDNDRKNYQEIIQIAENVVGHKVSYKVLPNWQHWLASLFSKPLKETRELLPRYSCDNLFDSSKFQKRFPDFRITTYEEGIRATLEQSSS